MMRGVFKLVCAFGAMGAPTYAGWLWGQSTNLQAGIVILCVGTALGAGCMHGYADLDRREA